MGRASIAKTLAPLLAVQVELNKELPKVEVAPAPAPAEAEAAPATAEVEVEAAPTEEAATDETAETIEQVVVDAPESGDVPAAEDVPAANVPLFASPLQGVARGLAFQLHENLGSVSRQAVTRELRAIQQADRAPLRRLGVRFGAFSIFLPALVKPAAAKLKALLWAVHQGLTEIPPPATGLPSPTDPTTGPGFMRQQVSGCGPRRCASTC
jgi:hypothetical protein